MQCEAQSKMTELKDYTSMIKHRSKSIELSFWDIGKDLAYIQEKSLYKSKYGSLKDYIESNFSFSYDHARKMISVTKEYSRPVAETIGITKLYLLLQVPHQHRDEIIEMIEEKKLDREGLRKTVKRFKSQSGSTPHYSDKPEEHKLRLIRQFNEIRTHYEEFIDFKQDLTEELNNWLKSAKKTDIDTKEAENMLSPFLCPKRIIL